MTPSLTAAAATPTDSRTATRLLRAVIAKFFLDLMFICVVASVAAFSNFGPLVRGAIDVADPARVAGWAYDPQAPGERLEVQLFIDGRFAASRRADERRDDLVEAEAAEDAGHGYSFAVAPLGLAPGPHTAQVYAVRRTAGPHQVLLPLAKQPRPFQVDR